MSVARSQLLVDFTKGWVSLIWNAWNQRYFIFEFWKFWNTCIELTSLVSQIKNVKLNIFCVGLAFRKYWGWACRLGDKCPQPDWGVLVYSVVLSADTFTPVGELGRQYGVYVNGSLHLQARTGLCSSLKSITLSLQTFAEEASRWECLLSSLYVPLPKYRKTVFGNSDDIKFFRLEIAVACMFIFQFFLEEKQRCEIR